jgi:hypothetical protein
MIIIYDDRLGITIDYFYDLLLSKNAIARSELKNAARIERAGSSTFSILMEDGALAGWFALEIFTPMISRVQIVTREKLVDCMKYMITLTWMLLESIRGKEDADAWIGSKPWLKPKPESTLIIMPIMGDLVKLAMQEENDQTKNNGVDPEITKDVVNSPELWEAQVPNADDRLIIRYVRGKVPAEETKRRLGKGTIKTILNRESELRSLHTPEIVPYRQEWRNRSWRENKIR